MRQSRPLGPAETGRSRTRIAVLAVAVLPLWSLAHPTVTVPTLVFILVVLWALTATLAAAVLAIRSRSRRSPFRPGTPAAPSTRSGAIAP